MAKIDEWIEDLDRLRRKLDMQRSAAEAAVASSAPNQWERDAALTLKAGVR